MKVEIMSLSLNVSIFFVIKAPGSVAKQDPRVRHKVKELRENEALPNMVRSRNPIKLTIPSASVVDPTDFFGSALMRIKPAVPMGP